MQYGPYRHLDVAVADGIATLSLERPEAHNALDTALLHDLDRAFAEIKAERSVDAVVIEGAGDEAFSAGADLEDYAGPVADHDPSQKDRQEQFHGIFRAPHDCHAPVIAKIDGYCDLRIASERSTFGLPTAAVGLLPTGGATRRLVDTVGESAAKELVFTAELNAARAAGMGLLTDVVPADELNERVAEIVASMGSVGDGARVRAKRAINAAIAAPDPATAREREAALWWAQFESDERRERVAEFLAE